MNTHINMGGGSILRALFQTQDQVTGDNRCKHRQKQNQTKHSDNHILPLLCCHSLGSVCGQLITSCRTLQMSKQICTQLLHVGEKKYKFYYYCYHYCYFFFFLAQNESFHIVTWDFLPLFVLARRTALVIVPGVNRDNWCSHTQTHY